MLYTPQCCKEDPSQRPTIHEIVQTLQQLYDRLRELLAISQHKINDKEGLFLWMNLSLPVSKLL